MKRIFAVRAWALVRLERLWLFQLICRLLRRPHLRLALSIAAVMVRVVPGPDPRLEDHAKDIAVKAAHATVRADLGAAQGKLRTLEIR
jgi:hypothetical protein